MSLAWKQEYRMASEADQIDWSSLLHAFARPDSAPAPSHAPLAAQGLSLFSLAEDASALSTQAVAFEWLDQVLDLQLPAPFAALADGQAGSSDAVAELPSTADAGQDSPVSGEVTTEFKEMLAASWPAAQQMLHEAVLAAFPEAQFRPSKDAPALFADMLISSEATPLTPASDLPI